MKRPIIFAGLLFLGAFEPCGDALAGGKQPFPIIENVPHVWAGKMIHETTPGDDPSSLFILRYYEAAGGENWGPFGSCILLREVPEIGCLVMVWGIQRDRDGAYDFSTATFSHRIDDTQWFVAPPAQSIRPYLGDMRAVSVIAYRTFFKEHPKLGGRIKEVVEHHEVIRYARRTIQEVTFKMFDPAGKEMAYWFTLILNPPRVIEKEENMIVSPP